MTNIFAAIHTNTSPKRKRGIGGGSPSLARRASVLHTTPEIPPTMSKPGFHILVVSIVVAFSSAADWPQWGGSPARNNTPEGKNIPVEWNIGQFDAKSGRWLSDTAKNVLWAARLGSTSYGTPVVADGKVFCASNNGAGWIKRYPPQVDLGCLLCFRQGDGHFLWQLSREKLAAGRLVDYPEQGICCSPLVEGKRLWIVTNRCEVVCLDTNGSRDGANIVWIVDMIKQLGVTPYSMSACSVTAAGDLLLVCTSNAADPKHDRVPSPNAPSFIALDKRTGKLVWADNSPGGNLLDGQWSSPAFAVLGGVPQAIFGGGDGWIYSFRAEPTTTGKPELLWKFDANPKTAVWKPDGSGDRNSIVATPVIAGGRVYVGVGDDPEFGEGPGRLWCIDPSRRGDVSPELAVDRAGKPVRLERGKAIDPAAGETVRPNPNSAAVWQYAGFDRNGDGKLDFEETMHRTLSMAAIKGDLLVIADIAGLVHCLDAKSGKVHWTYDLKSQIWGSPCLVDGRVYLGDQDGDVAVFQLSTSPKLLATNAMLSPVYSTPIVADNVLYISTSTHLIAVGRGP
jgi:outer membrane protein assembly factor BamB